MKGSSMIVMQQQCEAVEVVTDADFGYWDSEKWGDSPIHEFECGEPADFIVAYEDPFGLGVDGEVALCAMHAKEALS